MARSDIVRARWRPLLLAATISAAVAVALLVLVFAGGRANQAAGPPVPVAGRKAPSATPAGPAVPVAAKSEPVSVDIPKIGAHSSLIALGLNADNTVQVPLVTQPMQAGWYSYGPVPGDPGPAVVLGHVDGNKQKGIFYRLTELARGDDVSVARKDGSTWRFVVTKVDLVPKETFPTDAVYGDTPGPELRLITCGGVFDHAAHDYRDNVIVYAKLQ
jgi:sortase (surface protein transpeptidase)